MICVRCLDRVDDSITCHTEGLRLVRELSAFESLVFIAWFVRLDGSFVMPSEFDGQKNLV